MNRTTAQQFFRTLVNLDNRAKRDDFEARGAGEWRYTDDQKAFALVMAQDSGIRAAARILGIQRRTIQRWRADWGIEIPRCPEWVRGWAERRKRRKAFWERRGYV